MLPTRIVADLRDELVGVGLVEAVVRHQPVHAARRTRCAARPRAGARCPRPSRFSASSKRGQAIAFFLTSVEAEGDLHRRLEAGAADLAVALGGVAVAEVEERRPCGRRGGRRSCPSRTSETSMFAAEAVRATGRRTARRLPGRRRHGPASGASGIGDRLDACCRAGPRCRSCARGRAATRSGRAGTSRSGTRCAWSGTSAPKRPPWVETAVGRLGRTFRISTTSVSPGSAPSIAIGPTSPGHLPPALRTSRPTALALERRRRDGR
mgnify:CR=1 FL=1